MTADLHAWEEWFRKDIEREMRARFGLLVELRPDRDNPGGLGNGDEKGMATSNSPINPTGASLMCLRPVR